MIEFLAGVLAWGGWLWLGGAGVINLLLQIYVVGKIILSRRPVGEAWAWIIVVLVIPFVGMSLYWLVGELRLGRNRARRLAQLAEPVKSRLAQLDPWSRRIDWKLLGPECQQLARAGRNLLYAPALPGNDLELLREWPEIFDRLIADIDSAQINCDFQFYIWHSGGRTDDVVAAVQRACQRGVSCRILVDSLGSRAFLRSAAARQLRESGAQVLEALPGRWWRIPFVRFDLRMHRKIVLIDDQVAWTGSLNMVDPRFFKQSLGVGQWIDAMVRVRGPAVEALAITFQTDWQLDAQIPAAALPDLTGDQPLETPGHSVVQVLPSGPAFSVEAIEQILISAVYMARHEVIITSPYFVPSEALSMALASAAQRGVHTVVIVPAKVDSWLVRHASRAFKTYLLTAGVQLALFQGGLLHTKSVSIDGETSMFGSLNMDPRSLRLNFEITLAVHDEGFTGQLRELQLSYLRDSQLMTLTEWQRRSTWARLVENAAQLLSPLL